MEKDPYAYTPVSGWETYNTPEHAEAMESLARRYLEFLSECKTERETVAYVQRRLRDAGYTEEHNGGAVVRPFRGKALFAARRGTLPLTRGLHLISAHADSPRLDFKQRPLIEQPGVAQAKTHYYGGIRKYQWLARPLALHGVIVRRNGERVSVILGEDPAEPVFTIADLLPHLAQKQNTQTVTDAFEAEKLNVILGHRPADKGAEDKDAPKDAVKKHVLELLGRKYDITEEDLVSAELQAVPAGPARRVGLDAALLGGYGQDDRICVFTALEALLSADAPQHTVGVIFWDKEEIGSDGATGASSRFFQYCVEDCIAAWQPEARFSEVMLATRALSADVQAALDPDWQDVHEKQNAAQLGYGACFSKFTGSRGKYGASEADAEYVGWLRGVLNARNIPWQMAECGRVDLGGGGTVALFLAAYGMSVIDLGPAVLSMHSPFELSSAVDLYATVEAYKAFMESC
ncbi:MAG: aminopeptidase [Desulfovibrionaceae bacterium]|nr:aminopeptidase [Desulfovibrionaceae bacterium]